MSHCYAVYILASAANGTLYVGVTRDLERRVSEHRDGLVPGFTQRYGVKRLVHYELFGDINDAIAREKQLKKWNREWKLNLIERDNPQWVDLASSWFADHVPHPVIPAKAGTHLEAARTLASGSPPSRG